MRKITLLLVAWLTVAVLHTPADAVTWVKVNDQTDTTVTIGQSFVTTLDCAPGGEVVTCLAWDTNANRGYDPGVDVIADSAALHLDNSILDDDTRAGYMRFTNNPGCDWMSYGLTFPLPSSGRPFVLLAYEVAGGTLAQCPGTFKPATTTQSIRGQVRNSDGTPAAGVAVGATTTVFETGGTDSISAGPDSASAATDSSGNYVIYLPRSGNYRVAVWRADGFRCEKTIYLAGGSSVSGVDFELASEPGCSFAENTQLIRGQVTDMENRPLPFARANSWTDTVYTDLQGRYEMRLPLGQGDPYIELDGYLPDHDVQKADGSIVTVMHRAAYRLQGTVTESGTGSPVKWLDVKGQAPGYDGLDTQIDASGRYIVWTDAGETTLSIYGTVLGYEEYQSAVALNSHTERNIQLRRNSAVLSGRVTDASGGLGGATVKAKPAENSYASALTVLTRPDGTYALNLTPGKTYNITFSKPGWQSDQYLGLVASGNATINRQLIYISHPPVLSGGRVTPESGDPSTLFTFEVRYSDADNNPPSSAKVVIDDAEYTMQPATPSDTNYADGAIFRYSTTLGPSSGHSFRFQASDTVGVASVNGECQQDYYSGPCVSAPPVNAAFIPTSGAVSVGARDALSCSYGDPNGTADLAECRLLVNTTLTTANCINVLYNANTGKLYLRNDANTEWLGGYAPGSSSTIENTYCRLYCADTTIEPAQSGSGLTVNWSVMPKGTMSGKTCRAWMRTVDDGGLADDWQDMTASPYLTFVSGPANVSLSPSTGSLTLGATTAFTSRYSDSDGSSNISRCLLFLGYYDDNPIDPPPPPPLVAGAVRAEAEGKYIGTELAYDANTNKLYARETNGEWIGGYAPGSANSIVTGMATLYCANTVITSSGTEMTVRWSVSPGPSIPGTSLDARMYVEDDTGFTDGWDDMGRYTINVGPSNMLMSPIAGTIVTGLKHTFMTQYKDENGAADLAECRLLVNTTLDGSKCINLMYNANENKLYVRNDTNTAWLGGYAPGSANTIENGYCKLYCAETTRSDSAGVLTINWKVEPKAAMSGKTVLEWMRVADDAGVTAGWDYKGSLYITANRVPANVSIAPTGGTFPPGVKQSFTCKFSDADGAGNMTECRLLLNRELNGASCINVMYNVAQNKLYVRNDANTGWVGGYVPGSTYVMENGACKLYCAESYMNWSGNTITVSWKIQPKPAFSGKICRAWLRVSDLSSATDGWDQFGGSYKIDAPPSTGSISPATTSLTPGAKRTIATTFTDPDGYPNLNECRLLMNTTLNGAKSINVMYNANTNKLYVRNDGNTGWIGGYAPGAANVIENGYCKLYCANTSKSGSGTTLTVNWSIEAKPTMAGRNCNAWLRVTDDCEIYDGWDKVGTLFRINVTPVNVSISPASGLLMVGAKRAILCTYSDGNGYGDLTECRLLVNTSLSGANSLHMMYSPAANKLYVRNDANTEWVGGYAPGSANTIQNSYCKLYCAQTAVTKSGNVLSVAWQIEPKQGLSPKTCGAWMYVKDTAGVGYWDKKGAYTTDAAPVTVSVSPTSSVLPVGVAKTISGVYSDPDGITNITECRLLMNSTLDGARCINVMYNRAQHKLYVRNNDNTAWLGGFAPGAAEVIESGYCRLYCDGTTVSTAGTSVAVNWKIESRPGLTGKSCSAWLRVTDASSVYDGWDQYGATYRTNTPPSAGTLDPSAGAMLTGSQSPLTATYVDPDGYADIAECRLLINTALSGANCAHVMYDANAAKLYVRNDANTAWVGGFAPGTDNIIENGYCRLNCLATTVSGSGSQLTIGWKVEPKAGLVGPARKAWMRVTDDSSASSDWAEAGVFDIFGVQ